MKKESDRLSPLISAAESMIKALQPYHDAVSVIQGNNHFAELFETSASSKLGVVNLALSQGLFEEKLSRTVSEMLAPYQQLLGVQSTITALGESFASQIKPDVYSSVKEIADAITTHSFSSLEIANGLKSAIDTSWMKFSSAWMFDKKALAGFDASSLSGTDSAFASLCRLEQATASLVSVPDSLISASSQIASICSAIKPNISFDDLFASTKILSDYCELASRQHELIQKADNQAEIEWHLDLLNATSSYVDRQARWMLDLSEQSEPDEHSDTGWIVDDNEEYRSAVSLIPVHIGYTKRENINKSPTEGLEESVLVKITEKGKKITDGILTINNLRLDCGTDRVFGLSETVVKGMLDIGSIVCTGDEQFGKVIDGLYFVFYENLEHIKMIIGRGDKNKGDQLVRTEDICQCIFNIKTMRSDLRHDLDHGSTNDRKKKMMNVGECYQKYCGRRPLRERDFKKLQSKLYDEIISLEDWLIDIMSDNIG